jgi:hypothetical protein
MIGNVVAVPEADGTEAYGIVNSIINEEVTLTFNQLESKVVHLDSLFRLKVVCDNSSLMAENWFEPTVEIVASKEGKEVARAKVKNPFFTDVAKFPPIIQMIGEIIHQMNEIAETHENPRVFSLEIRTDKVDVNGTIKYVGTLMILLFKKDTKETFTLYRKQHLFNNMSEMISKDKSWALNLCGSFLFDCIAFGTHIMENQLVKKEMVQEALKESKDNQGEKKNPILTS